MKNITVRLNEEMIEDLERENERLRNEKRLIVEQREEHTELVNAVKEERSLAKRKANASVFTRAKWWLVGMSDDTTSENGFDACLLFGLDQS